jgi:hypothetical protein
LYGAAIKPPKARGRARWPRQARHLLASPARAPPEVAAIQLASMASSPPSPALMLYSRPGCHLCDVARESLHAIVAERAAAGLMAPAVREVDISGDPALERRYLTTIPVLRVGDAELELATRAGQIRLFLSSALDESTPPRGIADAPGTARRADPHAGSTQGATAELTPPASRPA